MPVTGLYVGRHAAHSCGLQPGVADIERVRGAPVQGAVTASQLAVGPVVTAGRHGGVARYQHMGELVQQGPQREAGRQPDGVVASEVAAQHVLAALSLRQVRRVRRLVAGLRLGPHPLHQVSLCDFVGSRVVEGT